MSGIGGPSIYEFLELTDDTESEARSNASTGTGKGKKRAGQADTSSVPADDTANDDTADQRDGV